MCTFRRIGILLLLLRLASPAAAAGWHGSLEDFLRDRPDLFGTVMQDPAKYRLQIIYTRIDRDARNRPAFASFKYRVDDAEYFYPASTVKLPVALLALEKLNHLAVAGLDRDTPMLTVTAEPWQTPAETDPGAPGGLPSVGHYIRKILLVSDNDAFNRLYEFVGQDTINRSLQAKGYRGVRIMHRLEVALSVDQDRRTNPVRFARGAETIYAQPAVTGTTDYTADDPIPLGVAEMVDGQRVAGPKDFAVKNALPLQALHDVLQALLFPGAVPPERRFDLTDADYAFVYRNMSAYAPDSGIPEYRDRAAYPDGYVKFLMYGGSAEHIPDNIRIFNKVGDAYGFLTDATYIVDIDKGVEFILAATLYTNENGTFNDDDYEYDDVGLPFLRDLGMAIYQVETARERPRVPDLSRFLSEQGAYRQQEAESGERNADDGADDTE